MDLLLHPQTKKQIEAYLGQPVHAVLIEGQPGSGKGSVSTHIASELLGLENDKLAGHSFYLHIEPVSGTISIQTIRQAQEFMKLKTIGQRPLRRAVVLENAHAMTIEAQNAFLKLLEEPPADTVIILTAPPNQTLLPTIYSRVQQIQLKALEKDQLTDHFKDAPKANVERAFYMSNGQIGLMNALLTDDQDHPLATGIEEAKKILSMTPHDRLTHVDQWSKNKDQLPDLLQALQRVCHAALVLASEKTQKPQISHAHQALSQIIAAQGALKHNPNTKLLLTDLMLNL